MRFLVTPTVTEKLTSLDGIGLTSLAAIVSHIRNCEKEDLLVGDRGIEVRSLDGEILTLKHGAYRVYASFGSDAEGEYLLLLDLAVDQSLAAMETTFFAAKDPRRDMTIDPNRNMTIDPRRNMMIDPRRNMTIDPNRNMTIDPRRNMTIDPRRNMMIDPNRNMTIDPRRNMTIDPNRNMTIDPRRNRLYGGPYLYSVSLAQEGFLVRANEKVSLTFDMTAKFIGFIIEANQEIANTFDVSGSWTGFLIRANEVRLRFTPAGQWIGIIV